MTLPEAAFWGFLGAFAIDGLDLHAAWLRYRRLPWRISVDTETREPYVNEAMSDDDARRRMGEYIVAEVIRCLAGAAIAIAAAHSGQHSNTLVIFLFGGIESPLVLKRIARNIAMALESSINPHGPSAAIVRFLKSPRHKASRISNEPGSTDDEGGKGERL